MEDFIMDKKLQEDKVTNVEITTTEESNSLNSAENPTEAAPNYNDFTKKQIPIFKRKAFRIAMAILIYTIIVASVTVKIDRKIIAYNIEKSFKEAFNVDDSSAKDNAADSSANGIENKVNKDNKNDKKPEKEAKKLELNETVTIGDVMELTLESSEWTDEIKPSNTSGTYSYKADSEGEKYFVIKGKVKNIAGDNLDIEYGNQSKIIINDTYKANVTIESEEADGTSFYGSIKPLQTLNIIAYASLSDEAYNICENIRCDFDIMNDSSYINKYYRDNTPHDSFYIEFDNSMNKGNGE